MPVIVSAVAAVGGTKPKSNSSSTALTDTNNPGTPARFYRVNQLP